MTDDSPLLELSGVRKEFGGLVALDNIDVSVGDGELIGLIGPNGAGKSTLLNVVTSVHDVTEGRIVFRGENITSASLSDIASRGVMRTFQESEHFEHLSARKNLQIAMIENAIWRLNTFISVLRNGSSSQTSGVTQSAETVGLADDQLDKMPSNMTHLELTKLGIARVLVNEPELIMLDEPFAGLTAEETEEMSETIERIHDDGYTILLIDHNVAKVTDIVERVIVLDQGRIIAEDEPRAIIDNEQVQEAYFGT